MTTKTTKQIYKEAFANFPTTFRKDKVIIRLGYKDAPENFMQYSVEKEARLVEILSFYKIRDFKREEIKDENKYKMTRYIVNMA